MSVTIQAKPQEMTRQPLPKAEPCVLVIFGGSGDLTKRKLVPALYNLVAEGALANFKILGVDRDPLSDNEFRNRLRQGVFESKDVAEVTDDKWEAFAGHLHYMSGNLTDNQTYRDIGARLERFATDESASRNRLFYFSTPPSLAPAIVDGLGAAGLADERNGWSRIVVEKPFGRDLESALTLNRRIGRVFHEHQVYRIDHYLGKETVQNILVFRFGNSLFEPVWNRNYVDYVEITAAETLGVGSRSGYYEEAGALRDMVANHLLQLVTLTAMEPPVAFDADSVREEKVQVLRSIHPMTPEEVAQRTVRGQYGPGSIDGENVLGYREEKGVANDSCTETYVAIEFRICNWRWGDVPFYVRTGKRLSKQMTEIAVHLKRTPQALFSRTPDDRIEPNVIVLRIQPVEGITVTFGAKRPGAEMHTGTVHMDFSYQEGFGVRSPEAYETLLLDVMLGDATLFTRGDEVESQWKLITPIELAWAEGKKPRFPSYAAGSDGPEAANELLARNGYSWRPIAGK
ncbi:MAG TPA: glucose-6-phosphate dehydrogenase [Blastocatellia bacterium]|nr:glucose-6-phosphate dehydrogenase [Blastocatellia bacterium]